MPKLLNVLSGPSVKGSHPIAWTPELHKAFEECKASSSRATLLAHPEPSAQLVLVTDAPTFAMGVVLQQRVDNAWQPLALFSKKLNPARQKYSAYDRDLLVVYEAVRHFRHMLKACHFITLLTTSLLRTPSSRSGTNAHRGSSITWISLLSSPPTYDIYLDMTTLSPKLSLVLNPSPRHHLTTHWPQDEDNELRTLLASNTNLRLERQQIPGTTVSSTATHLPGSLGRTLELPYGSKCSSPPTMSHPGTKATAKLVAQHFVWPGMQKDCRTWARVCQACQRSKVFCHSYYSEGIYAAGSPFPSYPYRPRGASCNVRRLHILPHCS
jgi:cleavage and polyadenylation specificity factor subunit 1